MRFLYLFAVLSSISIASLASDPPYYLRGMKQDQDMGGINQNLRSLSDSKLSLTGVPINTTDTAQEGELDMNLNKMINVANPTNAQDAVTKDYLDTSPILASSFTVTNNLTLKQNGDLIITAGISGNSLYMFNDTGELNISTGTTILFTGQGDGDWVVAKNIYIGREMLNSGGCGSCLSVNQTCSAGKVVLGGGCAGGGAGNAFVNNFPNADNSWFCETESAANITVWVICARMQ